MIAELSYVGFGSPRAEEWRSYGTEFLGLMLAPDGPDGAVRLTPDDIEWRLAIHPAEQDELRYIGWGMASEQDLATYSAILAGQGIEVHDGDAEIVAERQVARLVWFEDPWGNRHELSWGKLAHPASFKPGRALKGRFKTEDEGLGHVVLLVPDIMEANAFFCDKLGFVLSDRIINDVFNLRFYHVNGRHHSLAVGQVPGVVGFNHLMLELTDLDDVGAGIDIATQRGIEIKLSLGKHTNDLMISTYVGTPTSFQIEYGWGGLSIDDRTWVARTFDKPSYWGHIPSPSYFESPPGILRPFGDAPPPEESQAPAAADPMGEASS